MPLADAAAADVFGFSFFGFLASRIPFGMAAAPSSGLSVAPVGEITSVRPKFPQRIVGISPEIARDGICMVSASKESGVGSAEPRYTIKPDPPQAGKVSSLVRRLAVHSARGAEKAECSTRTASPSDASHTSGIVSDGTRLSASRGPLLRCPPSGGLAQVPLPALRATAAADS